MLGWSMVGLSEEVRQAGCHIARREDGVDLARCKRHVPVRERRAYLVLVDAPIAVLGVSWGEGSLACAARARLGAAGLGLGAIYYI